jgi:protein-S-isoprenylcysteine O-methyltransferase Ste14
MNPLIPPPVVVVIIGVAMWVIDRNLNLGKFESVLLTPIAATLLVAGLLLMLVAVASFVAARTTINPLRPSHASSLITAGVFRLSRNPIYLADLLILAALAVWLGNVFNVVFLPLFVWYINRFQIVPEERALTNLFGEYYAAYCTKVRRWL